MNNQQKKNEMGIGRKLLNAAHTTGIIRAGRSLFKNSLTVINYHRISDPHLTGFDSFKPNVSATPAMFEEQMVYLKKWFEVISVAHLVNWLNGKQNLPPRAALITFDDGYLDNYTNAYPILQKYKLPAVIFLATGHIGTDTPFYWDLASYCFSHTEKDHVLFPDQTIAAWATDTEKMNFCHRWVEAMKILPDEVKKQWVNDLAQQLNVSIPNNYFKNLMTNWDQIREMSSHGIEFGGHTINHPILSRVSLQQAKLEIEGSKKQVEQETGYPALSFAYPNGGTKDFNKEIEEITKQAGYQAAFSLLNGPSSTKEVVSAPYAIRRVFILHTHSMAHFAALTSPINRYR